MMDSERPKHVLPTENCCFHSEISKRNNNNAYCIFIKMKRILNRGFRNASSLRYLAMPLVLAVYIYAKVRA